MGQSRRRWCAWDSNPGPQDGRRRQNRGAMAATPKILFNFRSFQTTLETKTIVGLSGIRTQIV